MVEQVELFESESLEINRSLFEDSVSHKQGALIWVLEHHCVGEEQIMKAADMLPLVNDRLVRYGQKIKDAFELRLLVKKLKNSERYLRKIGSTSAGVWLACKDDSKDANGYMISRTISSMETSIKNGVDINVFYNALNDLKEKYYPCDNQERIVFNTEKSEIKRYSDDLKVRETEVVA